tara:strand:- start:1194 stop:1685 length:492 start_codon:yes stop_codon:yes gene_type:complete
MNAVEIINFSRKPVEEVWFLRVTTVNKHLIPITKTAYRRISTPTEKLIDDLELMIRGRLNTFMRVVTEDSDESMSLEDAGFNFYLTPSDPSYNMGLRHWLELMMKGQGIISCIITNVNDNWKFEIIPNYVSKDEQPPKSFALKPSNIGKSASLFVKCVPVKVK